MDKYHESRQEVARSIALTIEEISRKYDSWTKETFPNYRQDRDKLNRTIEKAILEGDKETKESTRNTLKELSRTFYRDTKAKFNHLIKTTCIKHGRNEDHIRRVAGWPKATEKRTITVKSNL